MNALYVLSLVAAVSAIGLFFAISPAMTGYASGPYNVQYVSCHYLDQDIRGSCMRIEKQMSASCNPAETAFPYGKGAYGYFIRPCAPAYGNGNF